MAEPAPVAPAPVRLKVPPHSNEAEQSLLGGLMLDEHAWDKVADKLGPADFYLPQHRIIFEVMADLANTNKPLDIVTLSGALSTRAILDRVGGNPYLTELVDATLGTSNLETYAEIVKERSTLRQLIHAANEITDIAFLPEGRSSAEVLDAAEQRVFEIGEDRLNESGPRIVAPLVDEAFEKIDALSKSRNPITGLATGFNDLDGKTAGFQDSDLVIIAARPAMGKTALMVNIAEHAVVADQTEGAVLIFSMEQPADQLVMRMLSSLGRIDQTSMRWGNMSDDDWPRFNSARIQLREKPLYIDDTAALTPNDLRARARRVKREAGGLRMIMVDYLQLMRPSREQDNRTNEISEISRSLKAIAKEMKCPLVACSQLNRSLESRNDKRPYMSDLRESGAIEQDADLILFIYRDEVYNEQTEDKGVAEIIIGKQRNGPVGTIKLTFTPELTRFDNHVDSEVYDISMPPPGPVDDDYGRDDESR
ncbi:MAG: replicative DNA helicase [Gammaproteobacteria bacterium]|nr:replicative DNA helicase [Gammaproteobacteria bacterium]